MVKIDFFSGLLGVTQEIIRLTLEHAERAGARRITDIHLVVGELSGIVDDSIRFYFDFKLRVTVQMDGVG